MYGKSNKDWYAWGIFMWIFFRKLVSFPSGDFSYGKSQQLFILVGITKYLTEEVSFSQDH